MQYSDDKEAPVKHFAEALKRNPSHYKSLSQLGILYLDRKEYQKSTDLIKRALNVNRTYPLALVAMGNLYFETRKAAKSIKYF